MVDTPIQNADERAEDRDADATGYGKPPRNTRFKPGQSGNPRGRPKGSRGLKADLRAELDELVTITTDGKRRRISKRQLIIKALAARAAKGDVRAADRLLSYVIQAEGFEDQRAASRTLSSADRLMVERLLGSPAPVTEGQ